MFKSKLSHQEESLSSPEDFLHPAKKKTTSHKSLTISLMKLLEWLLRQVTGLFCARTKWDNWEQFRFYLVLVWNLIDSRALVFLLGLVTIVRCFFFPFSCLQFQCWITSIKHWKLKLTHFKRNCLSSSLQLEAYVKIEHATSGNVFVCQGKALPRLWNAT